MITVTAKLPRKAIVDPGKVERGIHQTLRNFAFDVQRELQEYPPAQSPKWKRTGSYGRGWTGNTHFTPASVKIVNTVAYATYVGGTRQRDYHRAHGWKNVKDVAEQMRGKWGADVNRVIIS